MSDKKIILLVDDDQDFIDSYTLILEKAGYEVRAAMSSKEGLETLNTLTPNLIILDIMMESADSGFEFAKEVKESGKNIPILLSSSIGKASTGLFDTRSLNVKMVLQKPVEFNEFLALVEKYAS